jgi:uncharacterized protein DUF4154
VSLSLLTSCGDRAARFLSRAAMLTVLLSLLGATAPAFATPEETGEEKQQDGPGEYEVKAAFLRHFAKYTTWPAGVFKKPDSPIVIWVIGKDPFGKVLDVAVKGKKLGKRAYLVRRIPTVKAALADKQRPHLLFVGALEARERKKLFDGIAKDPIVVIGNESGLAKKGALISFFLEGGRVRFQANPTAAKKRGIQFSSQFLRLAKIID